MSQAVASMQTDEDGLRMSDTLSALDAWWTHLESKQLLEAPTGASSGFR